MLEWIAEKYGGKSPKLGRGPFSMTGSTIHSSTVTFIYSSRLMVQRVIQKGSSSERANAQYSILDEPPGATRRNTGHPGPNFYDSFDGNIEVSADSGSLALPSPDTWISYSPGGYIKVDDPGKQGRRFGGLEGRKVRTRKLRVEEKGSDMCMNAHERLDNCGQLITKVFFSFPVSGATF